MSVFADLIMEALQEEADRVDEQSKEEIKETAKKALEIEQGHPNIPVMTGAYKGSFALKKTIDSKGQLQFVLHNKSPEYRKAHLLEFGHAKRNGGRTRAHPHWKDAQAFVDKLPERMKRRLSGGS
jgi:hypothetical protein